MSYTFRIRFNCSPHTAIQSDSRELVLPAHDEGGIVTLKNPTSDEPIKDAEQLVLLGNGYASEKEAVEAGNRFQAALKVALARGRIGADFGERSPKGGYTPYGLSLLEKQHGSTILNNVHGLMVFRTELNPRFISTNAIGIRGLSPKIFTADFVSSLRNIPSLTDKDQVAYSLFNGSFFQPSADGRFLMLVMAVEALIDPALRSESAVNHVDTMIAQTRTAQIPEDEKESILSSLHGLRKESISKAGQRLALSRLGGLLYNNRTASEFFAYAYRLRSNLVHGNLPVPTFDEIVTVTGTLEEFVSDLLTSPFLGPPQR